MVTLEFAPKLSTAAPAVVLPYFAADTKRALRRAFQGLLPLQKRAVRQAFQSGSFPKSGVVPVFSKAGIVFVLFLGEREKLDRYAAREAGEKVFESVKKFEVETVGIVPGVLPRVMLSAFREGVVLGTYEFSEWKGTEARAEQKKQKQLQKIQFVEAKNESEQKRLEVLFAAVKNAKDIINLPPLKATPTFLAETAEAWGRELKNVTTTILGEKELKKLGCGGILGVGQGSDEESRLIILNYRGGGKEKPLALIGKGVTYDTGGLSIKPSQYMATMKQDLGGAATVLGAFYALAASNVKKNILAVIPAVENTISAGAYKPDDILHMYNGKTVEVTNTDAEGRLILADALAYTEKNFQPRAMLDVATLTGACAYAVGNDFTGVLGTDPKLMAALRQAANKTDELVWELPLHQRYKKYLESPVADIVNASAKLKAGTIEGGLFLQHFVTEKMPWAHLDIASVAFDDNSKMATGRNVRMLWEFAENF